MTGKGHICNEQPGKKIFIVRAHGAIPTAITQTTARTSYPTTQIYNLPDNETSIITATRPGVDIILNKAFDNEIKTFYKNQKNHIFEDNDKGNRFTNAGESLNSILGTVRNIVLKNHHHSHTPTMNNMKLQFEDKSFTDMSAFSISCITYNNDSGKDRKIIMGNTGEEYRLLHENDDSKKPKKINILLSELVELLGEGIYIIIACRSLDTTAIIEHMVKIMKSWEGNTYGFTQENFDKASEIFKSIAITAARAESAGGGSKKKSRKNKSKKKKTNKKRK
jgi:hypothetical protein